LTQNKIQFCDGQIGHKGTRGNKTYTSLDNFFYYLEIFLKSQMINKALIIFL